jgi:hypothetical protein
MIRSGLVLLAFSVFEWLVFWSVRLLPIPEQDSGSAILRRIVRRIAPLVVAILTTGGFFAELFCYKPLPGHTLKDDNLFFVGMVVQGLMGLAIAFNSESALKRKRANELRERS